ADVTVGCLEMPRSESSGFGIMHVDANDVIQSFLEKPADPPPMPGKPDKSLASMGIYVFDTKFLIDEVRRDAVDPNSSHDFGKDIIPYIVKQGRAVAHQFSRSCVRSGNDPRSYWRDVGTVDAYWSSNIDLTDVLPELDLYDRSWPIWTHAEITPPAKFVHDDEGRRGQAVASLVSGGCIISGAALRRSLLFTGVHLHSFAKVENAVILPYVDVGESARLANVVIDRGVPGFPDVMQAAGMAEEVLYWPNRHGGIARLLRGACGELDIFVIDAPHLYARLGNPYVAPDGQDWPDNGIRFAALGRVAAD